MSPFYHIFLVNKYVAKILKSNEVFVALYKALKSKNCKFIKIDQKWYIENFLFQMN